ncbi:hypothetical protein PVAP13_1KG026601 [Panicum virgatum]|uniref:Uncharacterized protein n=1 Tax=Panicum virgatum TaxID=38727 RepID=A0A8T0XE49_PANVG|nr:hypothetical protein PVAP13_1KG026601 [Panicum virgatum]
MLPPLIQSHATHFTHGDTHTSHTAVPPRRLRPGRRRHPRPSPPSSAAATAPPPFSATAPPPASHVHAATAPTPVHVRRVSSAPQHAPPLRLFAGLGSAGRHGRRLSSAAQPSPSRARLRSAASGARLRLRCAASSPGRCRSATGHARPTGRVPRHRLPTSAAPPPRGVAGLPLATPDLRAGRRTTGVTPPQCHLFAGLPRPRRAAATPFTFDLQ